MKQLLTYLFIIFSLVLQFTINAEAKEDVVKLLKNLDQLYKDGVIDKSQFERSKKKILETKEQKAAEEKKIAEQKAAKEKKIAEQKAAEEKKIAEQKAAEEKKIAEQKAAEDKLNKKLSLIPAETDLEKAQNFLKNLQDFMKLYPDEFDIIKISEFFILTRPVLNGDLNHKSTKDLEEFKEFTKTSNLFVKYNNDIEKNKRVNKLNKINDAISNLENNIKIIKGFLVTDPNSIYLEEWLNSIKNVELIIDNPSSYDQLLKANDDLIRLTKSKNEIDQVITELNNNIDELKEILKQNLTSDLAPLLVEQAKLLETTIKKQILKDMNLANEKFEEFIYKNIEEPKLKAAEEKRIADEKAAEEKRIAEEKKRQEYLKTPEGQKEEKERIKKEKERLAEEKRLKNFKPISMTCTYSGQGGIKTYKWVFDGKNINWEGMNLEVGGEIDDGMGTKISTKKLDGRDNFQLDVVAGFIPMTISTNFDQRSSVMETLGIKIYGTCY